MKRWLRPITPIIAALFVVTACGGGTAPSAGGSTAPSAAPEDKEFVFFWASVAAAVFWWRRGLRVEALFIATFLLSFGAYLYRPFPFSRYASTLFPLSLMLADLLRRVPALQAPA